VAGTDSGHVVPAIASVAVDPPRTRQLRGWRLDTSTIDQAMGAGIGLGEDLINSIF